jgi:transcriptional regulator with XRE-family HTH domain
MIDHRQIRAARALLNWSQVDLARASGLATSSIKSIETAASARRETLELIESAFECNGIEFLPGSGVRLKHPAVAVHEDRHATAALLDDIYGHVQAAPDREVLIIGLDETFAMETDGAGLLSAHVARLTAAGVRQRILVCEGDTRFLTSPECYRWLPRRYFMRHAAIYIYGDRIAVHMGSLRRRAIIIEARPLAQHMRTLFALLWEEVSSVPQVCRSAALKRAG